MCSRRTAMTPSSATKACSTSRSCCRSSSAISILPGDEQIQFTPNPFQRPRCVLRPVADANAADNPANLPDSDQHCFQGVVDCRRPCWRGGIVRDAAAWCGVLSRPSRPRQILCKRTVPHAERKGLDLLSRHECGARDGHQDSTPGIFRPDLSICAHAKEQARGRTYPAIGTATRGRSVEAHDARSG